VSSLSELNCRQLTFLTIESVLVIENGYVDNRPATYIPYLATILNVADLYSITSAPEPYLLNETFLVPVGNVVGGGSIVNGMVYDRGSAPDYDAWEELGNEGWGWTGLKPYFKKSNHYTAPSESTTKEFNISYDASAYGNGPVQASIPSYQYPDYKTIFDSFYAENVSFPVDPMVNPMGAYWCPNDIDNATATRSNAHVTYYVPVSSRPNLTLLPGTRVNQILLDDLTATGVQIVSRADGSVSQVHANKEVILAAGGVFTPHLLM
jgi:choline dehydrogenase-like flavoprotein